MPEIQVGENFIRYEIGDSIHLLSTIPNSTVGLIMTSPPYNVGIDYGGHNDNMDLSDYIDYIAQRLVGCQRKLSPGAHMVVNMANTGRQPYTPKTDFLTTRLFEFEDLEYRGEIIWDKQNMTSATAWGSWCSANKPSLRDSHEYLLVWRKVGDRKGTSDITPTEFMEYTKGIWRLQAETTDVGHPAPYPPELVERIIKLYSFVGETVLDPFLGSGTTLEVCRRMNRCGIGFEINPSYEEIIKRRVMMDIPVIEGYKPWGK